MPKIISYNFILTWNHGLKKTGLGLGVSLLASYRSDDNLSVDSKVLEILVLVLARSVTPTSVTTSRLTEKRHCTKCWHAVR